MSTEDEELYPCVGVCMVDEDSGLCMGCGKPVREAAEPEPPTVSQRQCPEQG